MENGKRRIRQVQEEGRRGTRLIIFLNLIIQSVLRSWFDWFDGLWVDFSMNLPSIPPTTHLIQLLSIIIRTVWGQSSELERTRVLVPRQFRLERPG